MPNFPPITNPQSARQLLEQAVESLVAFIDLLDADPDNEPSLGWTEMEARFAKYGLRSRSDLEDENEHGQQT